MILMTEGITIALITGGVALLTGLLTWYGTHWYNKRKAALESAQFQADQHAEEDKKYNELYRLFLEERTIMVKERESLHQQLQAEREFFTARLDNVERTAGCKLNELLVRIAALEKDNRAKDDLILEQKHRIDEQDLQLHAQLQLIEVLQDELKKIKSTHSV